MDSVISTVILPLFGLGLVAFCLLGSVLGYEDGLRDRIQRISGFGLTVEVSVLTLLVIVGVTMSFTGIYVRIQDYRGQLERAGQENDGLAADVRAMERRMRQDQKIEMVAYLNLEGVEPESMPQPDSVDCEVHVWGQVEPLNVRVSHGDKPGQFRIVLRNITLTTAIRSLVVKDLQSGREWVINSFSPLTPVWRLKQAEWRSAS